MIRRARICLRRVVRRSGALCLWRGHGRFRRGHKPQRTRLGFVCRTCRRTAIDYEEFSLTGGYVSPLRKLYSRHGGGSITRTDAWTESRRGW